MKENSLLNKIELLHSHCTGCGACQNACQHNAIFMQENTLGFLQPKIHENQCISCGYCFKVCPVISGVKSKGSPSPDCLAVQLSDDLRKVSSSGGVFSCIANYVLSQKGIIFGAAIGQDLKVFHSFAQTPEELAAFRKSKYVQSDVGLSYRLVKENLCTGRMVLFSGTPCQVAGLYNFLGENPDNLITIDVLCHGVPSWKMLKDSLSETIDGHVQSVDFRPMNYGWKKSSEVLDIRLTSNKHIFLTKDTSAYEKAFHSSLALRDSCYDCKFSDFPRQGDLSLGDFWGIKDHLPSLDDDLGTSVVLLNTQKANDIFHVSVKSLKSEINIMPASLDWLRYNRIHAEISKPYSKDYFSYLYPRVGFTEAVHDALQYKAKIGIVGPWMNRNCGGALTYYALYETLVSMGYAPIMISQPEGLEWSPNASVCRFVKNPYPSYAIAPVQHDYASMRKFSENIETFIVGSDQLFTGVMLDLLDGYSDLEWVSSTKRKIAYAASFAYDKFNGRNSQKRILKYFLSQFDAFSVREENGVELVKNAFNMNASWVVDPVFLCPYSKWATLADRGMARILPEPYVFGYILDPTPQKESLMNAAAHHLNCSCCAATDPSYEIDTIKQLWNINTLPNFHNEELLSHIRGSQFVLTDSFHGMCFALIFRKPFAVVLNEERGGARFISLLKMLHLEWRIISNPNDIFDNSDLFNAIDTDSLLLLEHFCEASRQWLRNAITCPIDDSNHADSYEMSCNYTDRSIRMLEKDLKFIQDSLNGRIDWLISHVDTDYGVAIEKQWHQLEDHRKRLDGHDYSIDNLSAYCRIFEKFKQNKFFKNIFKL